MEGLWGPVGGATTLIKDVFGRSPRESYSAINLLSANDEIIIVSDLNDTHDLLWDLLTEIDDNRH